MDTLDVAIVTWLNGFAQRWPTLDLLAVRVLQLPTFKMLPIILCLVLLWTREGGRHRPTVLQAIAGGVLAMIVSRGLQNVMPHRPRPMHSEAIDFTLPVGHWAGQLREWSSMPSDHAALVVALVAGIWMGSRPLGLLAAAWAFLAVCLPRIYLGYHYPSDLVVGALIGVAATMVCGLSGPRTALRSIAAGASRRWPALFHAAAFLLLFQMATMFDDVRTVGRQVANVVTGHPD